MIGESVSWRVETCPAFEELGRILSANQYSHILDEYAAMLEEDPDYLVYHWMSTALKLQFQLKRHDIPALTIGGCIDGVSDGCCVVDALSEAIRRKSSMGSPRRDSHMMMNKS